MENGGAMDKDLPAAHHDFIAPADPVFQTG